MMRKEEVVVNNRVDAIIDDTAVDMCINEYMLVVVVC